MAKKGKSAGTVVVRTTARRVNVWVGPELGVSQGLLICSCGTEVSVADARVLMALSGTAAVGGRQFECDTALPEGQTLPGGDQTPAGQPGGDQTPDNLDAGAAGTSEGEGQP